MKKNDKKSKGKIPNLKKQNTSSTVILSKLNRSKKTKPYDVSKIKADEVKNSIANKIKNNKNIFDLFPDTVLSSDIMAASVVAPLDMLNTSLTYSTKVKLPANIKQSLNEITKNYIEENYSLEDKLDDIFVKAYYEEGAYVEVIIPEAKLDDIINQRDYTQSTEDLLNQVLNNTEYRFLGNNEKDTKDEIKISTESFDFISSNVPKKDVLFSTEDLNINITENSDILRLPEIAYKNIEKFYNQSLSIEDINIDKPDVLDNFFINNDEVIKEREFIDLSSNNSRESIGKPLILNPKVTNIIPVHVKNEPSKHIGYYLLVDEIGTAVTKTESIEDLLKTYSQTVNNTRNNFIDKAKKQLLGMTSKVPELENVEEIYNTIITNMLNKKLESGMFGELAEVNIHADVYRTMFYRTLKSQKTNILFIPKSMVAYYAFEFRDNGTGKSKLEDLAVLFSIRAIMLMVSVMGNVKNAVNTTEVSATLDETDQDPEKTKEVLISEILKSRQALLPIGTSNVNDIVDWAHKVGFKFNIKHPDLPDMDITSQTESGNTTLPDETFDDKLQERGIMSMGLTADLVKSGYEADFATTFTAKNLLFTKRVMKLQRKFNPLIGDHIKKLVKYDSIVIDKYRKLLKGNINQIKKIYKADKKNKIEETADITAILNSEDKFINVLIDKYIGTLSVTLPKPETSEFQGADEAFSKYSDALDTYFEQVFSSDVMSNEMFAEIADKIDDIKASWKGLMLRRWANENNYLPEVNELFTVDVDGNPIFNFAEEHKNYTNMLFEAIKPFLKDNKKYIDRVNKMIEKLDSEEEQETDMDSSSDSEVDNNATSDDETPIEEDGMSDDELDTEDDNTDEVTDESDSGDNKTEEEINLEE